MQVTEHTIEMNGTRSAAAQSQGWHEESHFAERQRLCTQIDVEAVSCDLRPDAPDQMRHTATIPVLHIPRNGKCGFGRAVDAHFPRQRSTYRIESLRERRAQ